MAVAVALACCFALASPDRVLAAQQQPVAQVASRVTLFGDSDTYDDPPQPPFTLYGTVFKRFVIERFEEGTTRVVQRSKGVTVTACSSVVDASAETPDKVGLPAGLKVGPSGQSCATQTLAGKVERTTDLKGACVPACRRSCDSALEVYASRQVASTGYGLPVQDRDRVLKSCIRSCAYGALTRCIVRHLLLTDNRTMPRRVHEARESL